MGSSGLLLPGLNRDWFFRLTGVAVFVICVQFVAAGFVPVSAAEESVTPVEKADASLEAAETAAEEQSSEQKQLLDYNVEISISGEESLKELTSEVLMLNVRKRTLPRDSYELVQRARGDLPRVIDALYSEGFYGGNVAIAVAGIDVSREDADVELAEIVTPDTPVPVTVSVKTGQVFHFAELRIEGLPAEATEFDQADLGLVPGEAAKAALVLEAEARIRRELRKLGYPLAAVESREIVVDHATRAMNMRFVIAPGGIAVFGETTVTGTKEVDSELIRFRRPYEEGEHYSPKRLKEYRKNLRKLEILGSIVVREGDSLDENGAIPITVEVSERKSRYIGVGALWSTIDGATLNAYWGHRNLFGRAEHLKIEAEISRINPGDIQDVSEISDPDYRLIATFIKPSIITARDDLFISAAFEREDSDAYYRTGALFDVRIRRHISERLSVEAGLQFERSKVTDPFGTSNYLLFGIPLVADYDSSDHRLEPTRGWRARLELEPLQDLRDSGELMMLGMVRASTYLTFDEAARFILAARLALGSAIGADLIDMPANRRFYAGGGGSIRGYEYQSVSPRGPDDDLVGGLSLFELSLELRTKITESIGLVPFIDVGSAYESSYPDFEETPGVGVGLGFRYHTAIGAVRLDVAVPLTRKEYQSDFALYVGLGQAF